MELEEIKIKNFRSIEDITIDNFYQQIDTKNKRGFNLLIGINGSGKSSILQAINNIYNSNIAFNETIYKPVRYNKDSEIRVVLSLKIDHNINKLLKEKSKEFFEIKNIDNMVEFEDIQNIQFQFKLSSKQEKTNNRYYLNSEWYEKNNLNDIQDEHDNFLWDNIIKPIKPKIIYWSYKSEYLLPQSINLVNIINGQTRNKPLENIFKLAKIDIKNLGNIQDASNRKTIEKELNKAINTHLKYVWKEFEDKVKINISLESTGECVCLVQDKDNDVLQYSMNDRSDGFRQFISFVLSISCEEKINDIKNSIILLDEPEIHIHPSGIEFLRDRLIDISKRNIVICATHSVFMIDKQNSESHILVSKKKGKTSIERMNDKTITLSDEVMRKGFGINYWKEILPQTILLVEGKSDKAILNKVLQSINRTDIFIQSCNGGEMPKIYQYASLDNLNLFILLDQDQGGQNIYSQILKIQKDQGIVKNNIFFLNDLLNLLPKTSTFEDVLEYEDFKFVFESYEETKNFEENLNILTVGMNKDKKKEKIDEIKTKISDNYKYAGQGKIKTFIENLLKKIENNMQGE